MSPTEILLRVLFSALIYPGFLFLIITGLLTEGLRRQFASRAEGRDAPPLLQPFGDILKLFRRTTLVPAGVQPVRESAAHARQAASRQEANRLGLFAVPVAALLALSAAVVLLPLPGNLWPFLATGQPEPGRALGADLLASALLCLVPSGGAIVLGSLGGSVYAQLSGSRVFQLLAACGWPYAVAVFGPALGPGTLDLRKVIAAETISSLGVRALCGLLFLMCLPVVLRLRPLAGSGGEVLEGLATDLGGASLALYRLMQGAERIALAVFFAVLYIPLAYSNPLLLGAGVLLALGLAGVVESLFSYIRLRDALNFYLRYANPAALILLGVISFGVQT